MEAVFEDPYMKISNGKEHYFGYPVPEGYSLDRNGVWDTTKKSPRNLCRVPITITKQFSRNDIDMIELTFVNFGQMKTQSLQVPILALQNLKQWRKYARSDWCPCPYITDTEVPNLQKFLKAILQEKRDICIPA